VDPVVSVPVEGRLPDDYVPEVNQRLALYKRLAGAADEAEVDALGAELADRFGPLPEPVDRLLDVVRIRVAARALGVEKVEAGEGIALLTFARDTRVDPARLVGIIQASDGRLVMRREYTVEARLPRAGWPRVRDALRAVLAELGA
jgi:transcription-repair coupling factor (superfamily II helicase)